MSKAIPPLPKQDSARLFRTVQLHEKVVLALLCIAAVVGFILVLAHFAQPTPAGFSVESSRSKHTVGNTALASVGQHAVSSATTLNSGAPTAANSGKVSPVPSSSPKVSTQQSTDTVSIKTTTTLSSNDGLKKTTVTVQGVVDTVQSGLKSTSLLHSLSH